MFKTTMMYVVVNMIIVVLCLATFAKGANIQLPVTKHSIDTSSPPKAIQVIDSDSITPESSLDIMTVVSQVSGSEQKFTKTQIVATSRPHQGDSQEYVTERSSLIKNMTSINQQITDSIAQITNFLNDTDGYSNDL